MFPYLFYTYLITNFYNGTLYCGHTDDIHTRMTQHVEGTFDGFSKRYGLKHLVWFEKHETRDAAFHRERRIKNWQRQWKVNAINALNPLWLDLHTVQHWPLPDETVYPDLYAKCLCHSLKRTTP